MVYTNFRLTNLTNTNFEKTKFSKGNYEATDLRGVDLSTAKLKGATVTRCDIDNKTSLPDTMPKSQMKLMDWADNGVPPWERKQNKKAAGPLDFGQFMARLTEVTDASRLKKSVKMLKADAFELFSEIGNGTVTGIVKSQTDASLVYSCQLTSSGEFSCCTQKLNPCGGLRGALCKHLLVLIIGLTKDGKLDPTDVDDWANKSKRKSPELDKDRMSEILLKYKGAEAGDIDWRPTETVPEDFLAF